MAVTGDFGRPLQNPAYHLRRPIKTVRESLGFSSRIKPEADRLRHAAGVTAAM